MLKFSELRFSLRSGFASQSLGRFHAHTSPRHQKRFGALTLIESLLHQFTDDEGFELHLGRDVNAKPVLRTHVSVIQAWIAALQQQGVEVVNCKSEVKVLICKP